MTKLLKKEDEETNVVVAQINKSWHVLEESKKTPLAGGRNFTFLWNGPRFVDLCNHSICLFVLFFQEFCQGIMPSFMAGPMLNLLITSKTRNEIILVNLRSKHIIKRFSIGPAMKLNMIP